MGDFKWVTPGPSVRELTDQKLLAEIAMADPDWPVRFSAVDGLTDRVLLARVAATNDIAEVREAAAGKLVGNPFLGQRGGERQSGGVKMGT